MLKFCQWLIAVIVLLTLFLIVGKFDSITSTTSIIQLLADDYQFIILFFCLLILIVYCWFLRTWYRRLATVITAWILGLGVVNWTAVVCLAFCEESQELARTVHGLSSSTTSLLGAFGCIAVLAYLDYKVKYDRKEPTADQLMIDNQHLNTSTQSLSQSSIKEQMVRTRYLQYIKADITNRIKASMHCARFIDLDIEDAPMATHFPWVYKDTSTASVFDCIGDALTKSNNRILLLGEPGAGKTTTLLHIAEQMINKAISDPLQPVPLLLSLTKLKFKTRNLIHKMLRPNNEEGNLCLEDWFVNELASYPGISLKIAHQWVSGGKVAPLLDGLDEVKDIYRVKFANMLNQTYLLDHPDVAVIVCSRVNEYLSLQDRQETRLQLNGAITLQPLTSEQIDHYLDAAHASGLKVAIPNDKALKQMAKTPLTLCMMTLAYGNSVPALVPQDISLTERRHQLLELYVDKMLQRSARRDCGIPYDESTDNDVPIKKYRYSPLKVKKYLGWLAVRMSVRMQTTLSMSQLFNFFNKDIDHDLQSSVWWNLALTRGLLLFVGTLFAGSVFHPMSFNILAGEGGLAMAVVVGICSIFLSVVKSGTILRFSKFRPNDEVISDVFNLYSWILFPLWFAAVSGMFANSLALFLPANVGLFSVATIILCMTFGTLFLKKIGCFPIGTYVVFSLFMLAQFIIYDFSLPWSILATLLTVIHLASTVIILTKKHFTFPWVMFVLTFQVSFIGLLAIGTSMIPLAWDLIVVIFAASVAFLSHPQKPLLSLSLASLPFILGGFIFGYPGAMVFTVSFGYITLLLVTNNTNTPAVFERYIQSIAKFCSDISDKYILSPILRLLFFFNGVLAMNSNHFAKFCGQALLIKQLPLELEFSHRMLRDYFALINLQSKLHGNDISRRHEAIISLGFQGEAAIDALAELLKDGDVTIRSASVSGLGRIASPAVIPYIEVAIKDKEPNIRKCAVEGTRNREIKDFLRLIDPVLFDIDEDVQKAVTNICLTEISRTDFLEFENGVQKEIPTHNCIENLIKVILGSKFLLQEIHSLIRNSKNEKARQNGIIIIGLMNDKTGLATLTHALQKGGMRERLDALWSINRLKEPLAIPALAKALQDPVGDIRLEAYLTLNRMGTKEALAATKQRFGPVPIWRRITYFITENFFHRY